jgi:hypothetical protein
MTDLLSPCPFCGSEPKVTTTHVRIQCSNWTSCGVKPRVESNDLDTAAARWNDRAGINSVTTSPVTPDESANCGPQPENDPGVGNTDGPPTVTDTGSTAND